MYVSFIAITVSTVHCINCMYLVLTFNLACTFEYISMVFQTCVNMYVQEYIVIT